MHFPKMAIELHYSYNAFAFLAILAHTLVTGSHRVCTSHITKNK